MVVYVYLVFTQYIQIKTNLAIKPQFKCFPLFLESDHLHIFGIKESVIYILDPSFIANVSFKLIIVQFKTQ